MSKTVIADSTCLIGLSRIGELEVLRRLFGAILIPPAVHHEVAEEKGLISDLDSAVGRLRQSGFYFL